MVVLCFSVGFKEGLSEMSDWLEQLEEGGMDSNDQTKGKEAEEEEQGELLASIEAESSCLETELKGLMRLYVLMLFQRERKGELVRVEKKQKELNTRLGELRRVRDLWLEADKDEVTVVDSDEDRSGGVDLPDLKSRKAGGCLTFLLHLTECSTETRWKEKEKRESKQSPF